MSEAVVAADKRWESLRQFDLVEKTGDLLADLKANRRVLLQRGVHVDECRAMPDLGPRCARFVASTGGTKRDGHRIYNEGWKLHNFLQNPMFCWSHEWDKLPLGHHLNAFIDGHGEDARLIIDSQFADAEDCDFADKVYRFYVKRHLRSGSVGFTPLKWRERRSAGQFEGLDYLENELLEFSAVGIPADPDALAVVVRECGADLDRFVRRRGGNAYAYELSSRDREPLPSSGSRPTTDRGGPARHAVGTPPPAAAPAGSVATAATNGKAEIIDLRQAPPLATALDVAYDKLAGAWSVCTEPFMSLRDAIAEMHGDVQPIGNYPLDVTAGAMETDPEDDAERAIVRLESLLATMTDAVGELRDAIDSYTSEDESAEQSALNQGKLRVIKEESDGWHVYSKEGKHLGGPYETKKEANDRLKQIE